MKSVGCVVSEILRKIERKSKLLCFVFGPQKLNIAQNLSQTYGALIGNAYKVDIRFH